MVRINWKLYEILQFCHKFRNVKNCGQTKREINRFANIHSFVNLTVKYFTDEAGCRSSWKRRESFFCIVQVNICD